jgi:hypothetical protein
LDGNGDESGASAGVVDVVDYSLWKAAFGATLGEEAAAKFTVPEADGWGLAILAAVLSSLHRWDRWSLRGPGGD